MQIYKHFLENPKEQNIYGYPIATATPKEPVSITILLCSYTPIVSTTALFKHKHKGANTKNKDCH